MKILGLINCYNTQGLGQMTMSRNIASTSFLAVFDFELNISASSNVTFNYYATI